MLTDCQAAQEVAQPMTITHVPARSGEGFMTVEEIRSMGFTVVAVAYDRTTGRRLNDTGTLHHRDGCWGAFRHDDGSEVWHSEEASDGSLAQANHLCHTCLNSLGLGLRRRPLIVAHAYCRGCGFNHPAHLVVDGLCQEHREAGWADESDHWGTDPDSGAQP
jgi:hypothetical protein